MGRRLKHHGLALDSLALLIHEHVRTVRPVVLNRVAILPHALDLAAKAVSLQLRDVVRRHARVIEAQPLPGLAVTGNRVVVPCKCSAAMHNHTSELVSVFPREVCPASVPLLVHIFCLEALDRVWFEIELHGKSKVVAKFEALHSLVVEIEASQVQQERPRRASDADALECRHLRTALVAIVRIVTLKQLPTNVSGEALMEGVEPLHFERDRLEGLLALAAVRASPAKHLLRERATEHARDRRHEALALPVLATRLLINLVHEARKEFDCVLMLTQVHGGAIVVPEGVPEPLRLVKVCGSPLQRSEHRLQLVQDALGALVMAGGLGNSLHARPHLRLHEELLDDRIHVACCASVLEAYTSAVRS
mmetsp:Transcript_11479/g.48165  ORF Transcript_11479/g.48165 Transcript_11479/m.48165 type:complete len:364 (+) Transcript_11479:7145-8236(+)